MNNNGIFNECKFINEETILNEGTLGLIALGIGLLITTYNISDAIRNNKIKNRIIKKLNNAKKRNKDIEKFDKNREDIKSISLKELLNRLGKDINDNDKYNLKHNKISIFTIDDKSGNMIAYAVYDELDNGLMDIGVNILKSYPKIVNNYIKALFELHIGIYGDGLKSFIKDLNKMPHPERSFFKTNNKHTKFV